MVVIVKTIMCTYNNEHQLNRFIEEYELNEYPSMLVQIYAGKNDQDILQAIQAIIMKLLPLSTVVGCTSSGQIMDGNRLEGEIVLSFTAFEKTQLHTGLFESHNFQSSYEMGREIAQELSSFDTKAMILLINGRSVQIPSLLEGIYKENPDVIISGGVTGDVGSVVLSNNGMTANGVAAVVLNNDQLTVETYSNFKWQEIGRTFAVTKSAGTVIYALDQRKPMQILNQYLGKEFLNRIPFSGVDFPFILTKDGKRTPVFVTKLLDSGAVEVSQPVKDGDQLVFAYAHLSGIIDKSLQDIRRLSQIGAETIIIFNCLARKRIMNEFVGEEVKMLNSIAPTVGFYTNGEILSVENEPPQLVEHSLSYMALSENKVNMRRTDLTPFTYDLPESLHTVSILTNLMQASQEDIRTLDEIMKVSEQYYRSLFDNNTDIVFSTDLKGNFTSINPAFEKTTGFMRDELLGKSALKFVNSEDITKVRVHFYRALKGKEQEYIVEIPSKANEMMTIHLKNIPITINGENVGIYAIGRDITTQKKTEEKIIQLAYFDQDTGLPNRVKFTEKLAEYLQRAKKKKRMLALLVIDMDRFKIINDSLGYEAGDIVLKDISERINAVLPSGAILGRFGGDKFSVILSRHIREDDVIKIAKAILRSISAPITYANNEFFVTASIGVCFYPEDGLDEITLLKNADLAMNRSKYPGGNRVTVYANEMNDQAVKRLEFESYLRRALKKNEFFLCYQPLIDLGSGKVYGTEALIRWHHPKLGVISPGEFIPLAEETGLIDEIGSWVLKKACRQNKKWQRAGMEELTVSVNVSAIQFQQKNFVNEVKIALKESGLSAEYLTLELTEGTMLRNIERSIHVMKELQSLGVKVSIDDFGTGYSSFSYLRDLPINTLKIDRSFINNLRVDTSDIAIVRAIITMSQGLSVKVVAEGVETKEQIELLKELNCHYAQGFYIDHPLTIEDFEENILKKHIMKKSVNM